VWWWMAFAACDGSETGPDCDLGPSALELGTGEDAFVPLSAGDPLPFVLGPQGGYHVYGSLRATGVATGDPDDPFGPQSPLVTFVVTVDGAEVAAVREQPRPLVEGPGGATTVGQLVVFSAVDPTAFDGAAATFSAELSDACGTTLTDERAVVLRLSSR
jgi:hypothetical protein